MIRPSAGTAKVLGFNNIKMETPPTCAYLMIGSDCAGKCKFCSQSSISEKSSFLSRVTWKEQDDDRVFEAVSQKYRENLIRRVCFQVVQKKDSFERTLLAVKSQRSASEVPICVSINGIGIEEVERIFEAGADIVAISFDAATPSLYREIKGMEWEDLWNLYIDAAGRFPGKIVVHLIAGLGETEEEFTKSIEKFSKYKTPVSLFAFTPLPGTLMKNKKPPELASYRRLQAAHFIIRNPEIFGDLREYISFENGRIIFNSKNYGFLVENIKGGAFMTYGCKDCNRPLYNEKPGQIPYNYPRELVEEERIEAVKAVF